MVEGAALEMLCGETHLGFESLTLRTMARSDLLWAFLHEKAASIGRRRLLYAFFISYSSSAAMRALVTLTSAGGKQ